MKFSTILKIVQNLPFVQNKFF